MLKILPRERKLFISKPPFGNLFVEQIYETRPETTVMVTKQPNSLFREAKHSATRSQRAESSTCISFEPGLDSHSTSIESNCDMEKLALGVKLMLEAVGEDVNRIGLLDTPSRVARMYRELLYGTGIDPASEVTCQFEEGNEDPVIVKNIPFTTICEHHLVPFIGKADVAYIPKDGRITGLSKIARVVEVTARRLQVQERMTAQIADAIMTALEPQGVVVVLNAEHLCMSMRGVKKPGSLTTTMAARGLLKEDREARREILGLIAH